MGSMNASAGTRVSLAVGGTLMENMGMSAGTRFSVAVGGTPSPVAGIFCTPAHGTAGDPASL
jgi:hypothetical protein